MKKIYKIIFLNIVLFLICLSIASYKIYRFVDTKYQEKLAIYRYLDAYVIWSSTFKVTYYTNHVSECSKEKWHTNFGITASGLRATKNRTIAVDPSVVKLGSILIDTETNQKYTAEDTGNGVKGHHVDVYIGEGTDENRKIASKWGCRRKKFIVLE